MSFCGKSLGSTGPTAVFSPGRARSPKYVSLNYLRRRRRDRHVFLDETIELLSAAGSRMPRCLDAERRALQHCLEKLTPEDRDLVARCYAPHATIKSVAEQTKRGRLRTVPVGLPDSRPITELH